MLIALVIAMTAGLAPLDYAAAETPILKPTGQHPAFIQPKSKPEGPDAGSPNVASQIAPVIGAATDAIARILEGIDHTPPASKPNFISIDQETPTQAPMAYAPVAAPVPQRSKQRARTATGRSAPASRGSASDLKTALKALGKGDARTAMTIRNRMKPSLDRRIIEWRLIMKGDPLADIGFISDFAREAPHWPNATIMRSRAEIAFYRSRPSTSKVIAEFKAGAPVTTTGKLLYARALKDAGHDGQAARAIRELWRTERLSSGLEKSILGDFSKQLRHSDHRWRVEMLLYAERTKDALRNANKHLPSAERSYVKARIAVIRKAKNARSLMRKVPRKMKSEAGYIFANIQMLRRANKDKEAIALMLKAPRKLADIVDGDEWWIERRLQSRSALDLGDARSAYAIAAGHAAEGEGKYAEAEFHAGWYALRFLNDPRRAEPHFRNIDKVATLPITISRAAYWQGRTAEALGQKSAADRQYRRAAAYSTAYYGQLARERLGIRGPAVGNPGRPTRNDQRAFDSNELVQAIHRIAKAGRINDASQLFRELGLSLQSSGEIALAVALAEKHGKHQFALMVGKLAAKENNDFAALAFPTSAIPKKTRIGKGVEKPVVYAIARQESAFNPAAVSHAGARGLLQLMPATAKRTARNAGMTYSKSKLTRDPAYNATLGAAHLGELVDEFNGSYIMTFAAYNAGSSRVVQWIKRFGDPRSPKVDAIDWIERIPFTETRNYVQRITENLQVYRARLNGERLNIVRDITRGNAR